MKNSDIDQEFGQMDIVKCKEHPKMVISFLHYKYNCPYTSRLACVKCLKEQNIYNGFEDLLEVLNDCRALLNKNDRPQGIYDLLNEYFKVLEQDPEEFINSFKEDILKQIQKLHQDLKEGIERYNRLRQEITKVKQQFGEALGHAQFRQAFRDILKLENYHQSEEWGKLEDKVSSFVLQFEDQKNQELIEAFYRLKEMAAEQFLQPQLLNDYKSYTSKSTELLCKKLENLGNFQQFTQLCDHNQVFELLDKIENNQELPQNIQLIFKASRDGMNAQAFWNKCQNQGPTLTICKSRSGHIFGGYTPCRWIPNGEWQNDDSRTSFIFQYTKKEIYPIISGEKAILCNKNNGPTFGGQHNLYIEGNFKSGYSNLTGQYYSTEKYKVENYQTHLMESPNPELVEMKVFSLQ